MKSSRLKRVVFRLLALALSLLPVVLAELLCGACGWGEVDPRFDPFVGFSATRPLFVASDDGQRMEIATNRQVFFCPDSFAREKPATGLRVFCLGGSTVQGRPYAIETSFTTWLRLSLQAAQPDRPVEVVNCGGISYASYRLVPILREVLRYQPDLIVVYTGHNEFLEDRTYRLVKQRGVVVDWMLQQAERLRCYRAARAWFFGSVDSTSGDAASVVMPEEVTARLDYAGGLEQYHWDPAWRNGVVRHFAANLDRMVALCDTARVPIWLVDPVANLRSCPPFKSEHRSDLSDVEVAQWNALREEASRQFRINTAQAVELLEQAHRLDPQHAGLCYDLAKGYDAMGRFDEAKQAYVLAKDTDVCPLRVIEPLRDAIHQVCQRTDTPLIDVHGMFQRNSREGIPGGYLLVDHVHPSISGHQMVAELIMETMVHRSLVKPTADWKGRRDTSYQQHIASLDDTYYLDAQRRLEGLRKWAAGQVKRTRATPVP